MAEKNDRILTDIAAIKSAIDQTKVDNSYLKQLLLHLGICNLIFAVILFFGAYAVKDFNTHVVMCTILQAVIYAYLTVLTFHVLQTQRHANNKYYVACISFFGVVAILMPFLLFIVRMGIGYLSPSHVNAAIISQVGIEGFLNNFTLSIFLLVIGISENKKSLVALCILNLLIYLILISANDLFQISVGDRFTTYAAVYSAFVQSIGYIVLGWNTRKRKMKIEA